MVAQMVVVVHKQEIQMEREDLLYHPAGRKRVSLGHSSPRRPPGDALTKQLVRDGYLEALQKQKVEQQGSASSSKTPPCVWHSFF